MVYLSIRQTQCGQLSLAAVAFCFLLLLLPTASALSSMYVPAVSTNGQGILTTIEASVQPGSGNVYVDVQPLISQETQQSARIAAEQAAKAAGGSVKEYDFFFKIRANTESVDGPSGGHALALLAYAEITGKKLRSDLTATGSIETDGSIGKVGGILEKVQAAHDQNVKLFLLPLGQGIQNGVDLGQYAESRWNMQIAETKNLAESINLAFTPTGSKVDVPVHLQSPLVLESVAGKVTGVDVMKTLAEGQYVKLQGSLAQVPADSVMAQQLRQSINLTRQLLDNGYYYSAANEAFITKIQADAYTLSNASKEDLIGRISQLEKQMDAFVFTNPTRENLEWFAGAKLRFFWAKR
ncbi:MAG: S16 family serine protease, partial [Candidatus Micrarchaeota archaeon]|nr:S16 family serine protease [Candidatus Micrarchaeota archaeon]